MKNTMRFSKNYTIKRDSDKNKSEREKIESRVTIRQHVKEESKKGLHEVVEFIKDANSCVILELGED